jgi:hypothetical protein
MTVSGYSGVPLLRKLGIREEMTVQLINPPTDYFALLKKDISAQLRRGKKVPDLVHLFTRSKKDLEKEMRKIILLCRSNPNLIVWVSWYKKSAGILSDVSENDIREYALQNGLVDIKVCAVSEQWSGLKLVVRKANR